MTKKCRMSFMDVPFLFIERLLDLSSLCIRKRDGGTFGREGMADLTLGELAIVEGIQYMIENHIYRAG